MNKCARNKGPCRVMHSKAQRDTSSGGREHRAGHSRLVQTHHVCALVLPWSCCDLHAHAPCTHACRNVGDENTGQLPWASVDGPASIPAPDHSSSSASAAQGGGGSGSQGSKRGSSVGSASSATAAATSQGLPGPRGSGPGMGALPTAPSAPAPAAAAGLGLGVIAAPGPGPVAGATAGAGLSTEVPALQGRPSAPAPAGLEGSEASPSATPAAGPAAASNQHTTGKVGTAMHSRLPHAPTGPGAGAGIGAGAAAVLGVGVQPATMGISTEAAVEAASAVVASADGRLGAAGDTGGALAPGPSAIASRKSQEMATLGIAPRSPSISSLALRHGPSRLAQVGKGVCQIPRR